MKPQKIIMVEPRGVEANVFAQYLNLPLMGPLYLGTLLKHAGHDVTVYNENILGRGLKMSELSADVLCLSPLTSTAHRAYDLARQFKAQNAKGRVLIGGIHASFLPEEAAQFADQVVIGEGEQVILDLIENGSREKIVSAPEVKDLDRDVPLPDFNLLVGHKKMSYWPIITSRGCPHACNFCAVTQMYGRKYRAVSVDRVMEELKQVRHDHVFFYDDNLTAHRRRTYEILDRMMAMDRKFYWIAQVRAEIAQDQELIQMMRRSGCRRVFIGFESINPETLKGMQKGQDPSQIIQAIETFHRYGIAIHGMFIFGSDEDSHECFKATAEFCRRHRLETVQFMILTPLPGTELFQRMQSEDRLLHKLWQYYDGQHTVFKPAGMTAHELQAGMLDAFEDFYSALHIINDALNEAMETGERLTKILTFKYPYLKTISFDLKTFAAFLIRKWQKLNGDYMQYLKQAETYSQHLMAKTGLKARIRKQEPIY